MAEDERTRRWQRLGGARSEAPAGGIASDPGSQPREADPLRAMRTAITAVRYAPRDPEARRRLRALAADQGAWEQLAVLLLDETRAATDRPDIAAAFWEELADVHENLDQPLETISAMEKVVALEPDEIDHLDRLAWQYRKAGAAFKAAQTFERVADLARDDRTRAALRAAGRLYRDSGKHEDAIRVYRAILLVRPSDTEACRALEELLTHFERWREVADVRGALAEQASGVDKAVLMRAQARALEQAGETRAAAELVAAAARHAPDHVSGVVDYASMLAREGRAHEAADLLGKRVAEALTDGAPPLDISALRLRLVDLLDETGQPTRAAAVLDELLAATPEYVPALERLCARAAHDPDPRVHAAALLRMAAAIEGAKAVGAVAEAARRYRDAGDLRLAARTFLRASELNPDDDSLRDELEDAQRALVVEIASAEAAAGDSDTAEQRLRQILATYPLHIAANLALVDVIATHRPHDAAEHLRTTLAAAPPNSETGILAKLVHRYARVMSQLGELDEAHQLLHEAHHLDRRNLEITLALGESCFSRKLWREAAIHLGALAEHAQARRYAKEVAAGLVRAGQAEVRALKPQNSSKHYEAAVRIDVTCAAAWHALAEQASERGDMVRAAECLDHEAAAVQEPAAQLRLYNALGDLALDVLGDAERAERAWARVAGHGDPNVLEKLLALQRARGATIERGDTCERLAASVTDVRQKKQLTVEAIDAFVAGGDPARARAVAEWLVSTHPYDPEAVTCASRVGLAVGDHEVVAGWLRRALGNWDASGNRGEGDPSRAELWRRLGDAERGRRNQRAALEAYQRSIVTAPDSDGAHGARRGLIELAASSGRAADTSRIALVQAEQNPADVLELARELGAADEFEDARALYELAGALGVELAAADERFLDEHPGKPMAYDEAYAAVLDDSERLALFDDPAEGVLHELLSLLGEAAGIVCSDAWTALDALALFDAQRVTSTNDTAVAKMYPQIAKALGGPATLLFASPSTTGGELQLILASPPIVLVGPRMAELIGVELRFRLGRMVEMSRPHRAFATGTDIPTFAKLVAGLWHAFGNPDTAPTNEIAEEAERLRRALPVALRRRITERLAHVAPDALDPQAYLAACERAADRAGLVACNHAGIAIRLAGGPKHARHLVELAASQRYRYARRKLRRKPPS